VSEVDMCIQGCGTPIPDGGTWGYCDNCWNYVRVSSSLEKKDVVSNTMKEVDLQTQLNCALELLTKEQHDAWELQMQLLQKECELMDAKREITRLREEISSE